MASSGIPRDSEAKRAGRVINFEGQDYEKLKRHCLQEGKLFVDPKFETSIESTGLSGSKLQGLQWIRPKDICKPRAPQFICEGMVRTDVCQGKLGDCWFLAAATGLTLRPKLLHRVVPQDQSFDREDYAGIFHFRFWQFGRWVDVVVDDRLLCRKPPGKEIKLAFVRSTEKDEFWMPLLEKAFAKLNGSYKAIVGGSVKNAFVDLTGGIGEIIRLKECGPYFNLCKMIRNVLDRNALMGAGIKKLSDQETESALKGLKGNHAYSITGYQKITARCKKMNLLRLRNPWGKAEWTGDWSDMDDKNWLKVDPELRKKLLVKKEDGEFWMTLEDFYKIFHRLHICYLGNNAPKEIGTHFRWHCSSFQGRWKRGTLWNPQFQFSLLEPDEDSSICTLISLTQRDQRKSGKEFLKIGFAVYKVTKEYLKLKDPAQRKKALSNRKAVRKTGYKEVEDLTEHFELPCRCYVIIPKIKSSKEEGDFLLRIFTEKKHEASDISLNEKP